MGALSEALKQRQGLHCGRVCPCPGCEGRMGRAIYTVKAVVTLSVAKWNIGADSPYPKSDSSSTHPVSGY